MKYLTSGALRIIFIYALFGLLWILISDRVLLFLIPQVDQLVLWQTYKGLLFVTLSTLIIYSQVARAERQNTLVRTALADSEERYRLLFNNNPLPMWVYDLQTLAFLEVNEAAVQKYGYSRNEFLGQTIKDIRPSEDVPLLLEDVANTTARFNFAGEWRHTRKDGSLFLVEIVSHYLIYNGRSARLVVTKDLTEQKRVEAEKNSIFQRNQALVQALGEIVYEWTPQKNQVVWQGDYQRILGYSLTEIGNTTESWLSKIHPEDQAKVSQRIDDATAKKNLDVEYRFLQADGTYRWMQDRGVIFTDAQGQLEKIVGVFLDIHHRKQTEEALRQSELRFRHLADNAQDLIYSYTFEPEPHFSYVSPSATKITGFSPEEHYQNPNLGFELIHPNDQYLLHEVRQGQRDLAAPLTLRWVRKDGVLLWTEQRNVPVFDAAGRLIGLEGIARDITENVRTQQALKESELRLRRAIEFAPFPILIHAEDGEVLAVSQTWLDITGYTAEAIKTVSDWTELAYGANQEQIMAGIDRLYELDTRVDEGSFVIRCKDGSRRTWEFSSAPLGRLSDGRRGAISIAVDTTERREAENQLRLQSSALNAAANGIVITDVNGLIEWANPAFTELTGYTLEEALGRNPRQLVKSGVHDEAFYRQLWETILCGNVWRGELVNRRKDGVHYVEEEAITPVFNEKDAITHFIAIKQDITKRKEAEKEREQLYRQERLAAIGQLAAGIAHDFNNLLAVILLYSQLLARSPNLNPKEQGQLTTIGQQAERAARLINQILDFSRRAVFEKRPLDLLVLLKEEVKLLQRTLPENIEIELAYEADTCVILADVTRVEQTIMNLAFNARDAMPEGGTLRFALSQVQVEAAQPPPVAGMSSGAWVKLSVQDTGTGIAPEIIDHIFEPFVTTKEPGKGTGLGLSQVHGIVAQHNGFIDISSRLGQGSLFEIYLPVWQVEPETAVDFTLETAVSGQGQRLLIIEDEPALRSALHASLSLWQYEVLEAPNGEMALAMLQAGTAVDLIISDMIMPKMGGIAFVQALRKLGLTTPVIFITGHPFTSNPADLPALGVKSILPKPLSPTELNQAVAQALSETAKDG